MRVNRYNFPFVIGLVLTLGISTVFANGGSNPRASEDTGTLSVETTPVPMEVYANGKYVGMSGVGKGNSFKLPVDSYTVEVRGPNNLSFTKPNVPITRKKKTCICLTVQNKPMCPYKPVVEPTLEGETVRFNAKNLGTGDAPTSYKWVVSEGSLTGQQTSSITVSSKGLAGKEIRAKLDLNDDKYARSEGCKAEAVIKVPEKVSCPYRFAVKSSAISISEGEEVTFYYENAEDSPTPSRYNWKVTSYGASIISGRGTPSITVSSKGIVGQEIVAELDTNDDGYNYDTQCTEKNSVPLTPEPPIEVLSWDLLKGVMDIKIIGLNQKPNHTLYIAIYPGTDKASRTLFTYDRVMSQINKYLTGRPNFVDATRIKFQEGENRVGGRTYVRMQIVPPGRGPDPFEPPPPPGRRY